MLEGIKDILFLDFETYYAQTYTLRTLTIPEYLLDNRYETLCCAVACNSEKSYIVEGPDFGAWISKFDPQTTATVTFNALFDNSILAWHYGWVPKLMLDSMNMARALQGHILPRLNLETVCKVFKIPHDKSTIKAVINMRREKIKENPILWNDFCNYANRDNEASREIFKRLIPEFPSSECRVMDLVIRCAVQPRFMLDKQHLVTHLESVRTEKVKLLEACGLTKSELMSADKFRAQLEGLGVEIEYKTSKDTGEQIPAFAKTDEFMSYLQNHENSRVQALACARLGVKSTLEETRTEKLIKIASLPWGHSGGECPIPLRYAGAHTHRLSGDWKLNMQNMPRSISGTPSPLRKALVAPLGYVVVAGDLAQIEARLVAWLAGAGELLEEFSKLGGDPYSSFASIVFGIPIDRKKNKDHFIPGFIGKTAVLGLGYQCGAKRFFVMVETLARTMGIDVDKFIPWTPELAGKVVKTYRNRYPQVANLWMHLQWATHNVWLRSGIVKVGPVTISYGKIEGPNGLSMLYDNPGVVQGEYLYNYGYSTYKMYGGKMLENIVQFLARIIIMNAALRLECCGYQFALQAHDELVFLVPKEEEDNAKKVIYRELIRRPSWGRDIPLDAEVKSGPNYGELK